MASPMFETWGGEQSPITIEYSLVVIEEIRHEVSVGLQKFARGGIEVGGILYGTREGRTIRIKAARPIHCEHKRGPSFVLSETDQERLQAQIREDASDPSLEGLISVGWYVSHTRGDLSLTEGDQQLYKQHFNDPWQCTLVVRPGRGGTMRAAFFVWEADMTVNAEKSYKEFQFPDRLAGVLDRGPRPDREPRERTGFRAGPRLDPSRATEQPAPPQAPASPTGQTPIEFGASIFGQAGSSSRPEPAMHDEVEVDYPGQQEGYHEGSKTPWVLAVLVVLIALAGVGWYVYLREPAAPLAPIDLAVIERDGVLDIGWDTNSPMVQSAVGGALEIVDGDQIQNVDLSVGQIQQGDYPYTRQTGNVQVRLKLLDNNGVVSEELSRFLGRPPQAQVANEELQTLQTERDELQAEVNRLRSQSAAQQQEIQRLERTLQILQTRLGIVEGQ